MDTEHLLLINDVTTVIVTDDNYLDFLSMFWRAFGQFCRAERQRQWFQQGSVALQKNSIEV